MNPEHPIATPPLAPGFPIYLPGGPDNSLPLEPGEVWPPLPPSITGQVMCLVWVVGVGYRFTVIDASLKPANPIVPPSAVPELPEVNPQKK